MESNSDEEEIKKFIEENPGCSIYDIVRFLNIDPVIVIEIVNELRKDGILITKAR